jgi:hypothetical protein
MADELTQPRNVGLVTPPASSRSPEQRKGQPRPQRKDRPASKRPGTDDDHKVDEYA